MADTSGICTLQIPDQVVLCFTYNRQSVEGTAAIAWALRDQRKDLRLLRPVDRVVRDVEGLAEARQFASARLNPFLLAEGEIDSELEAHWQRIEIPHYASYGFEETLAAVKDVVEGRNTLLQDMEVLAITLLLARRIEARKLDPKVRERLLRRFALRCSQRRIALDEAVRSAPPLAARCSILLSADARRRYRHDSEWLSTVGGQAVELSARLSSGGSSGGRAGTCQ